MFAYLSGILAEKLPGRAIIDCAGVGYDVLIPLSTYDSLPAVGSKAKVYVHFSMNDDGIRLFGFSTALQKQMFQLLISVSRIGPKLGLAVLSAMNVDELIRAISQSDDGAIAAVPGLGKKSAQRLIIELKDKLPAGGGSQPAVISDDFSDAESALLTLGYKQFEIRKAWKQILKDGNNLNSEELIKLTIKYLYKKVK